MIPSFIHACAVMFQIHASFVELVPTDSQQTVTYLSGSLMVTSEKPNSTVQLIREEEITIPLPREFYWLSVSYNGSEPALLCEDSIRLVRINRKNGKSTTVSSLKAYVLKGEAASAENWEKFAASLTAISQSLQAQQGTRTQTMVYGPGGSALVNTTSTNGLEQVQTQNAINQNLNQNMANASQKKLATLAEIRKGYIQKTTLQSGTLYSGRVGFQINGSRPMPDDFAIEVAVGNEIHRFPLAEYKLDANGRPIGMKSREAKEATGTSGGSGSSTPLVLAILGGAALLFFVLAN